MGMICLQNRCFPEKLTGTACAIGESTMNDVKYGFRQLAKNPGFTAVAVLTLALGIGGTTAMFSLINTILLKPLPFETPGKLVQVWEAPTPTQKNHASPGAFLDWQRASASFEDISTVEHIEANLTGAGEPERIGGMALSASGLRILRARPVIGRIFSGNEDAPGADRVVVLAYEFWQRRFGANNAVLGQVI